MSSDDEGITWEVVNNTVAKRMVDSSLVHKLVAKRKLKRRTRILNCMIKKMRVQNYSQYIKMKTSVLRNIPNDTDSDDNGSFTDEDYEKIYKSEDSIRKYLMDTSKRNIELSYMEDSDEDYISLSQSKTNRIQHPLGWHRVLKKKSRSNQLHSNAGMSKIVQTQKAIRHIKKEPEENSIVRKMKKVTKKSIDKKSISIQKSIKELFIAKKLCNDNDVVRSENNAEDISDANVPSQCDSMDNVLLYKRVTNAASKKPESRSVDDNKIVKTITRYSSQHNDSQENIVNGLLLTDIIKQESSTEKKPDEHDSQQSDSQDNITNGELLSDSIEQEISTQRKSDECTTDKRSDKKRKESCKQREGSSAEKKGDNSIVKETNENNKENVEKHVSKANKNETAVNVKKNLMGAFNNFSVISGHKVSELSDSNANESIDISKSQLRMSDISPLCRSTPVSFQRTASKVNPVSENQPKDSGIDEDSQEDSSENGKAKDEIHKRILLDAIQNDRISESSESNNSSDLTDQPTMVIDEDGLDQETGDEDGKELEKTLIINDSQVNDEEETHKQKHQPKVTCTEIVNQKYKIITAKPQDEIKMSKDAPEKEYDHDLEINDDDSETETQVLHTKEEERPDNEDSENPDETMSATSKKRLQQFKRLNLTADSNSSEDEDYTACKSQKVSLSTVEHNEEEERPDNEEDSENPDETMSATSKKRLQQFKRLNLTADSNSSEDEDYTACKSQKVSLSIVEHNEEEEMPDNEEDSENPDETMSATSNKRLQQFKRLNLTADSNSSEDEDYTACKTQKASLSTVEHTEEEERPDNEEDSENPDETMSATSKKRLQQFKRLDLTADSNSSEDEDYTACKTQKASLSTVEHAEEQERPDNEEDSENPDETMSATSKKRLQQLKRLNLTGDSSSSEDEDYTMCKSQKVSVSTVAKDETDDDSDEEESICITKSQNLKDQCESVKSTPKKHKRSQIMESCSENNAENKAKDDEENQSILSIIQDEKSFSFSESDGEVNALRETNSTFTHKSHMSMFERSTLSKVDKHTQKEIANASKVAVGVGQTQTDIHIPPKVILKRPNNLQEYAEQEVLRADELFTPFPIKDLSDNEIFIIDIPKKLLNLDLIGQKIVLTKNKLNLGKQKYKVTHKDVESVTCVLSTGDVDKPHKAVQLKPAAVVITQAKLDEESSTTKSSKVDELKTTKNLPSKSGSVSTHVKKGSNHKSIKQPLQTDHFIKPPKKRKLNDFESLAVPHKEGQKRKRLVVCDDDNSS